MSHFTFQGRRAVVHACAAPLLFAFAVPLAQAATIRGTLRDPLGRGVPGTVALMQEGQEVTSASTDPDGTYVLSAKGRSGRFSVRATAAGFAMQSSAPLFASSEGAVEQNIFLRIQPRREDVTVTATGLPTPLEQTSVAVTLIPREELATRFGISDELRLQPGVSVVQSGGYGGITSLFVRGGDSTANLVMIDGVPANDVGGRFDFSNVSSTAVSGLESQRGPNSVLYGTDALAGTIRFDTPRGSSRPVFTYSGDAGNFHTWRNEAEISGAHRRLDGYAGVSRFDSSNALPGDRFHLTTVAANVGVQLATDLSLRGTVRSGVSATGVPGAWDFYGLASQAKQADQDLYLSGVLEGTLHGNLHQTARYLGARKREQYFEYGAVGTPVTAFGFTSYYGNVVTIRGANGTVATGQAEFFTGQNDRSDSVSDRDGVQYNADYRLTPHLAALAGFRFLQERGSYRSSFSTQDAERRDYQYTLQLQGDVLGRIFYSLGGALQHNTLYGTEGTPRLGIAGYAIRPGQGWLHGTRLHFNFSKGVQEPSLAAGLGSLYTTLAQAGNTAAIAQYHVDPIGALRNRTYEGGLEQSIYGQRLMLRANYFHNQFGRQVEYVGAADLQQYFGIPLSALVPGSYGAYTNSLDYRAQGVESALEYSPMHHLMFRGGYTYLDAKVERSFSGDVTAVLGGFPNTNPNYPDIPIGSSSPLIGARPFRRAPHTGFAVAEYASAKWTAGLKAAFSSRSDDSTFLSYASIAGDNSLLLPNRNLAYGFVRLDADATWQVRPQFALFSQMNNLLGQQRMGPIGYPALPFNFRVGVKVRLSRD
ncbi:TonB-dependent receptor [Terriglobus aquaticus]|uniref:TonB-dependent receptor n=1 Tax=Terriglobus aquaticus TaxID=940139 RepID=A0ABW9KKI7_9BACT|nr:TonB-dependent receptor [Terriglobus aquaticus]